MEARGRKARVDEFFPSKKRRCSKPDSKSKGELTQGIGSPSPSKKGNLDDYLIPTQISDSSTLGQKLVEVQDLDTPPMLETCITRGVNGIAEGKGWVQNQTFSLQRCSKPSQTHTSNVDTSNNIQVQDKLQGGECNIASVVDEFGRETELDDFANDFLSICCSITSKASLSSSSSLAGLSTNDGQEIADIRDAKNHKNVSVTCLNDEIVSKMKVHNDVAGSRIVSNECINNQEYLASRLKENEPSAFTFESPNVGRKTVCSSLSGEKRKTAITPRTSSGGRHKQTAKWSAGKSIFSPGDDFWDEAINLTDALVCTNAENDVSEAANLKSGDLNLHNEKVSLIPAHVSTGLHDVQLNDPVPFPVRNTHRTDVMGPEISPFPVRRFDFTADDKLSVDIDGSISCALADKTLAGEPTNTGKISYKFQNPATEDALGGEIKTVNVAATSRDNQAPQSVDLKISSLPDKKLPNDDFISNSEYTGNASQKSSVVENKFEFTNWLPAPVCSVYGKKGLKKLYPWQVECLQLDGVLDGRNLVYCASTSAGKSLVAEILMLRQVLSTGKKALLVLPFVSICSEKAEHLERLLEPMGKSVSSFFGTRGGASLPKDSSIAVCTIEKANSLINKLLEEGRLPELAVVVIDELHMVGDKDRGYLLELMLTKLRYAAGEGTEVASKEGPASNLQIIGMSATMPNAGAVASWLKAALYETDFRPVPLVEYVKVGNVIYNKQMEAARTIRKNADLGGKDPDHVVELCNEIVQEGNSVLLFCSSRKACETSAKHVAKFLPAHDLTIRGNTNGPESAAAALEELQKSPSGLDPVLAETLPKGVAYHHAGLTVEEREMVELCYRSGIVRVLTATSTLAAGVNLPARRVIFRQPRIGRDFIDGTRYRQMAGRAGRAGIDTRGESILICKPEEVKRINALVSEGCQPLLSCLAEDKNGMTRAIMEVVAGGIVQSAKDVERYVKCTLLNSTQDFQDVVKSAQDSLHWLCHRKFLEWDTNLQLYNCTPLGKAAFGSSLSPEESLIVFEDLAKAREGFVLASDLHLVYQVTPIYVELEPDWSLYYKKFVELSPLDQAVGNRVGVMEPFLMRMAHGAPAVDFRSKKSPRRKGILSPVNRNGGKNSPTKSAEHTLRVCKRFYVSLMLAKLIQEVPLMEICESFKVARGMVQSLQEVSGRFASMVSAFCERIGWHDMEGLVSKFQSRVSFGVRAEIVELAEIPFVKASRARALYKAGFKTPQAVAEASISELVKALYEFASKGSEDGSRSNMQHRLQIGMARKIQNGARKLVLERAEEARVAAFSALCALGVDVPHALSKPLPQSCLLTGKESEENEALETIDMPVEKSESTSTITKIANTIDSQHNEQTMNTNSILKEDVNLKNTGDALNMGPVDVDHLNGGFNEFLSLTQNIREFFFDLHYTSGTDSSSHYFDVKGIAICWVNSPIFYVSLENSKCSTEVLLQRWEKLMKMFSTEGLLKITWNWQSQVSAFKQPSIYLQSQQTDYRIAGIFEHGNSSKKITSLPPINAKEPIVDLRIAAWLLWPDEESADNVSLDQEMKKRLPGIIVAKANRDGRWVNQMGTVAHNGCCKRVSQIRALHSVVWKLLVADGLDQPLLRQEMPLVPILSEMESRGIRVDMDGCKCARQHLETKIKELESQAHVLAGVMFSLSVPAEVANVLYSHLKLPIPAGCQKGKKQHPSTDKQALDALKGQHPIVDVIKEHRTLSKVLNGTLGSILFKAKPFVSGNGQSGSIKSIIYYIKGHWLHTATSTGRLSMEEPNLQCVEHPLHFTIMKQFANSRDGKESEEYTVNARDFFIPFQEEWVLISADYSQIEVRLMAHFSGDSSLIELLSRPSGDLFKTITARWTGIAEDNVTAKQRENTKRLVYGILYGMGINALAEQLECSVPEATEIYNRFKAAFPSVAKWLKDAVQNCRERGYITTLAGRRRYLDKIKCGTAAERAKAERQAVNSICQGSAADLIKIAMIKLVSGSGSKSDPSSRPFNGKYNLLLQIHDELVMEVDKTVVHEIGKWLQSCMESAASLKVPLRVKLKSGPKWGSLQPLELT